MTIFKFNKESYFYNELPGIVIITAIGQLQAGAVQNQTAAVFGVSTSTISKLKAKYNRECQRPTSKWAHFLSLSAFTIFRQSATVKVFKRLWQMAHYTFSHCPALFVLLSARCTGTRTCWNVMFCNESRFCL